MDYELLTASRIDPGWERQILAARADGCRALLQQNTDRCREAKIEHLRLLAEKTPFVPDPLHESTALPLPNQGQPFLLSPEQVGKQALPMSEPISSLGPGAMVGTQLLVIGFLALFLLSFLSRLFPYVPAFWPEQALLAGLVGTISLGLSVPGMAIMVLGVAGRLIWLGRFLWKWANRLLFTRSAS